MHMTKKRLDLIIKEKNPHLTRTQIQNFIAQEQVIVDGQVITKPGVLVSNDAVIELLTQKPTYVSRAGFKLEAALKQFSVDVTDLVVLDAGISTGGFTDCLLQHGAKRIYGIDVGPADQIDQKIRTDARVIVRADTNLRYLTALPELVDLATLDLSFISLLKVMPALIKLLKSDGKIIALIKPQFEVNRQDIRRGGVVKDEELHQYVIEKIRSSMNEFGFTLAKLIESPLVGATSGNKEFLGLFVR